MDEIRNELLNIRNYALAKEEEKRAWLEILLERFEIDLERKKEDLENELKHVNDNLELLELVKNQIEEGVKNEK
jgi:hypothetical protein